MSSHPIWRQPIVLALCALTGLILALFEDGGTLDLLATALLALPLAVWAWLLWRALRPADAAGRRAPG